MNIILAAINAKYIHSNLAVYSLRAYAGDYKKDIQIAEYTINQRVDDILMDLYKKKPDMLCISCYIWNRSYVEELVTEAVKIMPDISIWLGGPEVSYDAGEILQRLPMVSGVMKGEGEATFLELIQYMNEEPEKKQSLHEVKGITFRTADDQIIETEWREAIDLSTVPFVYQDLGQFRNKIIYYESSRGCPFSCSYCLSSIDKCLRFRDLSLVEQELQHFIDHKIPQVKFVDRTFNCSHERALAIWKYLIEHDNGVTNFHFEVAADLLNQEEIELIGQMRPGLIQLEIGVQSTNAETITEIKRVMDFEKVSMIVKRIAEKGNIHQHLDLIAGLPFEDLESFRNSFNQVYELRPDQLQLGFLKVLKGSYMESKKDAYELVCKSRPPYEVLRTRWLSYEDVLRLKGVEEMVEVYYNSGQFQSIIRAIDYAGKGGFDFYDAFSRYYEEHGLHLLSHTRVRRYEILMEFLQEYDEERKNFYKELLVYDFYARENVKNRPEFAGEQTITKDEQRFFYEQDEIYHSYLSGYASYERRQVRKMTHLERFEFDIHAFLNEQIVKEQPVYILFDYQKRNPLSNRAVCVDVTKTLVK